MSTTKKNRDKAYRSKDDIAEALTRDTGLDWSCSDGVWRAAGRHYELRREHNWLVLAHRDPDGNETSEPNCVGKFSEIVAHINHVEIHGLDVSIDSND